MSMIKALTLATLIPLGVVAAAGVSQAQGFGPGLGQGSGAPIFENLDADGSGGLTLQELTSARSGMVMRADSDGDGLVTEAELEAMLEEQAAARVARLIERLDGNEDGAISAEEIAAAREAAADERREARAQRLFDRVDADGDGESSAAEFDAARERFQDRRGGRGNFGDRG